MRKWLSMLLVLTLAVTLVPSALADTIWGAVTPEPTQEIVGKDHTIIRKTVTMYMGSMDAWDDVNLYFLDGAKDLPWMELSEFAAFYSNLRRSYNRNEGFTLTFSANGDIARLDRETAYYMEADFDKETIYFNDYDGFNHDAKDSTLLDLVGEPGFDAEGNVQLIERLNEISYDRYGDEIELDLASYDIDLIHEESGYYVPMQTLSDFLVSPTLGSYMLYNGENAFLGNRNTLGIYGYNLTPMGEYYYSAKSGARSDALAIYGYNELCLMLDNLYGLKDAHDIESFDQFFYQMGMDQDLQSNDALVADRALNEFISVHLDDLHSCFLGYSCLAGGRGMDGNIGSAGRKSDEDEAFFKSARKRYYPDGVPFYEEVGNTAYITFDSFDSDYYGEAYYSALAADEEIPADTLGNIMRAHQQIYRNDSPIENVVIDLSLNGGGAVDAAVFLVGWIDGTATFSVKSTFTGAQSTSVYRADINLDREFDDDDELDDKNIYCLISPYSFSCANLVPMAFKSSRRVRLLGSTSGGGSCIVLQGSTAWGSYFTLSSPHRMSFQKNGSFYDSDRGVEPDFPIDKISHYYDREALTEYINSLF